jgi:putative tryptophan/tyrosine transport system substrate-binding protein
MLRAAALTVVLALCPHTAQTQPAAKVYRVGWLGITDTPAYTAAFVRGLRERGYREGENVVIERRYFEGKVDRVPGLAAELVRLKPDVIVTAGNVPTQAVSRETASIPIVMATSADPVGAGLVASLARPGGNITGMTQDVGLEALVKTMQLLKEAIPRSSQVAILLDPRNPPNVSALPLLQKAAPNLALTLHPFEIRSPADMAQAVAAMRRKPVDALLVLPNPVSITHRKLQVDLAAEHKVPAMYWWRELTNLGGLMSYGVDFTDQWRRAAGYVDRILKGAKPAELPIEQPTKFELVINLKTAQALGLTIPRSLLLQADELIE